jgi:hypothetical protein
MNKATNVFNVFVSTTEEGTVLAATKVSPFLCVEGATQEEAVEKATRALRFALESQTEPPRPSKVEITTPAWMLGQAVAV